MELLGRTGKMKLNPRLGLDLDLDPNADLD